jgi:protein gp37
MHTDDTTNAMPIGPRNVWLGVSVENQHFADERIQLLQQTPAAVRFISAEPLLEAIDIRRFLERGSRVDCCGEAGCEYCDGTGTCRKARRSIG